jgi:hypothetical protein
MLKFHRFLMFCSVILLTISITGCQSGSEIPADLPKLNPCKLTITQEGSPLEAASVTLRLVGGTQQWYPSGQTDSSGNIDFYTNGRYKGVPAGKYKIVATKFETEPSKLPPAPPEDDPKYGKWLEQSQQEVRANFQLIEQKFTKAETTTLEIDVTDGKETTGTFDVGKKVRNKM